MREKNPGIAIWWGGWFPSAVPELFLNGASADAVCIGQGELTFRDWLVAVRDGQPPHYMSDPRDLTPFNCQAVRPESELESHGSSVEWRLPLLTSGDQSSAPRGHEPVG